MASELYSPNWFRSRSGGARRSAAVILPILFDLAQPRRVVDVGCGTGSWLSVAREMGAEVLGIDGDYVDRDQLEIPADSFRAHDLAKPLQLDESFDLAICLEVGEHLPPAGSRTLVEMLTGLAPVVAFSAAIPGQGGTGHINERWQDDWARLFADRGYRPVDLVRPQVWDHPDVRYFYAQNLIVYVDPSREGVPAAPPFPLRVVHPELLESTRQRLPPPRDAVRHAAAGLRTRLQRLGSR
jgi:SAM-dependent methyltransferase